MTTLDLEKGDVARERCLDRLNPMAARLTAGIWINEILAQIIVCERKKNESHIIAR
jgi:hypothetical protein